MHRLFSQATQSPPLLRARAASRSFLLLLLLLFLLPQPAKSQTELCGNEDDAEECDALIDLWRAFGTPEKDAMGGWGGGQSYCTWEGIKCHTDSNNVDLLQVWQQPWTTNPADEQAGADKGRIWVKPSGTIPASIGKLKMMSHFYLYEHPVSGTIPPELGDCTSLEELWIFNTMVSGTLPPSLGQLTLMEKFYLPNNFISGTVPASLGNMLKLDELDFGENQLSGTIPTTLGELPRMLRMDFDFNHITHFPAELCTRLQSGGLRYCYMLGNDFDCKNMASCAKTYCWASCREEGKTLPT